MADHATPPLGIPHHPSQAAFGTDGLRGRVGSAITPALALQVGYWCGRVFPREGPVLIGMDSRSSGAMVMAALTAGLTAAGREVWTLGLCATPAVPLLIRQCGAAGGLMVSASHNPPHDTASRCSVPMEIRCAPSCSGRLRLGSGARLLRLRRR